MNTELVFINQIQLREGNNQAWAADQNIFACLLPER